MDLWESKAKPLPAQTITSEMRDASGWILWTETVSDACGILTVTVGQITCSDFWHSKLNNSRIFRHR